jgi:hypothetical protein
MAVAGSGESTNYQPPGGKMIMRVNPISDALAAALGRAHAALLADLDRLGDAAQPVSRARLSELRARLGATQAHIVAHFRFEEENGYMDAVRTREPRFSARIDSLAADHRRLSATLEAITRDAAGATTVDEALRHRIQEWIDELTRHELRENDLVQEVFNSDISAED